MARIRRTNPDPTVREIPCAYVDTETTSIRNPWLPLGRRTWEVAVRRVEPDGYRTTFAAYVDGVDLTGADTESLTIGGFYRRYPMITGVTAPGVFRMSEAEVAGRLASLLAGVQLVAFNVAFDADNFSWMLHRHGHDPEPWDYHTLELTGAAAVHLGWAPPYRGSEMLGALGINPTLYQAHTAADDARLHEDVHTAITAPAWRRRAGLDTAAG